MYIKAHTLNRNWAEGVYTVAPLLRGHRQRVTCIAHEGDSLMKHPVIIYTSVYVYIHVYALPFYGLISYWYM